MMKTATLDITITSSTCVRYELVAEGKRIWSNRVEPSEQGHAGARGRMAAWAVKHGVEVREATEEEAAVAVPAAARRYGRH